MPTPTPKEISPSEEANHSAFQTSWARKKMKAELDFRASGKSRRYSWDYDETYELYSTGRGSGAYTRLTNAKGYDAEGSWSPDGKLIVFASNRNGKVRGETNIFIADWRW